MPETYRFKYLSGLVCLSALAMLVWGGSSLASGDARAAAPSDKRWKILHIMSYHAPWKWTDDQLRGFKYALKPYDIEYRVYQMDTKRRSSPEWKVAAGQTARDLIGTWRPDLVYTNDDNAQAHVAAHFVNQGIPFVFSGVNAHPRLYGYVGSRTHTGVLEQEHFIPTIELLKRLAPNVRKIAVILDDGPTWPAVRHRMEAKLDQVAEIQIVSWDVIQTFDRFQTRMRELQSEVDAVGMLGIFTFKDENGQNVPYQKVLGWVAQNSHLPDFSFWKDRITYGTLCTVTVSGYEQGLAAGKMAQKILIEGQSPARIPMQPTILGEPVINLARAKKLGLKVDTSILLSVEIIETIQSE